MLCEVERIMTWPMSYSVRLNAIPEVERQPLFVKRTVKNRLYIVITSNSGLAGAYNANVLKLLTHYFT